ncbi:MAG: group 1 truncated hemoglobin [Acidimicrobiia bacterium]|nr:group 1 truncated hemoglobin [Acidimicrobiia bacterium]
MQQSVEALGGRARLVQIVSVFYRRVLDSARLAPYFRGVAIESLIEHQALFMEMIMGGGGLYTNKDLEDLHDHLHVTDRDFDELIRLLHDTLAEFKVPEEHTVTIHERFLGARDYIVSSR